MRSLPGRTTSLLLTAAFLAGIVACSGSDSGTSPDDDEDPGSNTESTASFLPGVSTPSGTQATFRSGSPPAAGNGPSATSEANGSSILGGSSQLRLFSSESFRRVIVFVRGADGYYELALSSDANEVTLVITLGQDLPTSSFDCVYAIATASGEFGAYTTTRINPLTVGTGQIQVSVSWDAASDVDLHVVDPSGEEIFYGHTASASGGELDLDSNAGCTIDGVNNENITWAAGSAPRGEYTVRVNYWSSCDVSQTNYVVTVQVAGQSPRTFSGTLTGDGNGGGEGDGAVITRFTF